MIPRFWRKIRYRYELRGSVCSSCGSAYYPPRNICPKCRRRGEMREVTLPERGKVLSYTELPDGRIIALVELENGVRVLSQIVGGEAYEGMEVVRCFRRFGEEGEDGIIYYGTKFAPSKV